MLFNLQAQIFYKDFLSVIFSAHKFYSCYGHPTPHGTYHYHQLPICLYNGTADEFIGVALDGFPIYGPNATDLGREVINSDLDECHGRNTTLNGVQAYRYYITRQYPYILGCFKGDVPRQREDVPQIDDTVVCSSNATGKERIRSTDSMLFLGGNKQWHFEPRGYSGILRIGVLRLGYNATTQKNNF